MVFDFHFSNDWSKNYKISFLNLAFQSINTIDHYLYICLRTFNECTEIDAYMHNENMVIIYFYINRSSLGAKYKIQFCSCRTHGNLFLKANKIISDFRESLSPLL